MSLPVPRCALPPANDGLAQHESILESLDQAGLLSEIPLGRPRHRNRAGTVPAVLNFTDYREIINKKSVADNASSNRQFGPIAHIANELRQRSDCFTSRHYL